MSEPLARGDDTKRERFREASPKSSITTTLDGAVWILQRVVSSRASSCRINSYHARLESLQRDNSGCGDSNGQSVGTSRAPSRVATCSADAEPAHGYFWLGGKTPSPCAHHPFFKFRRACGPGPGTHHQRVRKDTQCFDIHHCRYSVPSQSCSPSRQFGRRRLMESHSLTCDSFLQTLKPGCPIQRPGRSVLRRRVTASLHSSRRQRDRIGKHSRSLETSSATSRCRGRRERQLAFRRRRCWVP